MPTPRFAITIPAVGTSGTGYAMSVNAALQAFEDFAAHDDYGLLADRPAAGHVGHYYWATDVNRVYRDTGVEWKPVFMDDRLHLLDYDGADRTGVADSSVQIAALFADCVAPTERLVAYIDPGEFLCDDTVDLTGKVVMEGGGAIASVGNNFAHGKQSVITGPASEPLFRRVADNAVLMVTNLCLKGAPALDIERSSHIILHNVDAFSHEDGTEAIRLNNVFWFLPTLSTLRAYNDTSPSVRVLRTVGADDNTRLHRYTQCIFDNGGVWWALTEFTSAAVGQMMFDCCDVENFANGGRLLDIDCTQVNDAGQTQVVRQIMFHQVLVFDTGGQFNLIEASANENTNFQDIVAINCDGSSPFKNVNGAGNENRVRLLSGVFVNSDEPSYLTDDGVTNPRAWTQANYAAYDGQQWKMVRASATSVVQSARAQSARFDQGQFLAGGQLLVGSGAAAPTQGVYHGDGNPNTLLVAACRGSIFLNRNTAGTANEDVWVKTTGTEAAPSTGGWSAVKPGAWVS